MALDAVGNLFGCIQLEERQQAEGAVMPRHHEPWVPELGAQRVHDLGFGLRAVARRLDGSKHASSRPPGTGPDDVDAHGGRITRRSDVTTWGGRPMHRDFGNSSAASTSGRWLRSVARSASMKTMDLPRARATPARTAAPFPSCRPMRTTVWGIWARSRLVAAAAVSSVLPSSTTINSESS